MPKHRVLLFIKGAACLLTTSIFPDLFRAIAL